jgi:hypothetical protein
METELDRQLASLRTSVGSPRRLTGLTAPLPPRSRSRAQRRAHALAHRTRREARVDRLAGIMATIAAIAIVGQDPVRSPH